MRHERYIQRARCGFSLIELIIIVVILAIVAAIASPQLGRAAADPGDAALADDLARLRTAIDMYTAEHGGRLPDAAIVDQLTQHTDLVGNVSATADAVHVFGPYLTEMPPLPLGSRKGASGVFVSAVLAALPPAGPPTNGWWFNCKSGDIRANLPGGEMDDRGVPYNQY